MLPKYARSVRRSPRNAAAFGLAVAILGGCERGVGERIRRVYDLGRNPTDDNKARIEALFHDPDRDVRAAAMVVMIGIDHERARRMAASAMADPDGTVRATAVPILAAGVNDEVVRELAARAIGDPAWEVRAAALGSIAGSDEPEVYRAFSAALFDASDQVRRAAYLAGVGRPGLLPTDRLVEAAIADPDWENRVDAARALGASQDQGAYVGLDAGLRDPNEFVRATAARELRTLEGSGVSR